ncbi:MAG TPA: NADH-quinone oxidoreductase subunit NuoE [Clostridiales bacterium]|nr:NADH-quinone oxidoreductase subunit NuoE [Clostridiales bacterium]HQP70292.1 NADH-quinone oxidoreductase subunit NuoE [Clostridiales bacterium]
MRIKRKNNERHSFLPDEPVDTGLLDGLLKKYAGKKGSIIPLLQGVQEIYRFIPKEAILKISEATGLSESDIFGVVTFYSQFRLNPVGKHIIKVCHGTACHVQNANGITTALVNELGVEDGKTTSDRLFTLESVACLGCCSLAPVMMIGEETYGKLTGEKAVKIIREIRNREK